MFTLKTKISMAKAILTKKSPFYIQFYISKNCNFKCKMCNIVEANADTDPFHAEKIEKIAENLGKIGAGVILLTGGEPFLRTDIDMIVKAFKSRGMDVRLQTNGFKTNREKILQCVANGARDISISLDTLDEDLFDYINTAKGSTVAALETTAFISRNFPPKESICAFGCVLSRYNIDEIEAILEFATRIGWWLSLVPVHITKTDNPLNFRGYDEYFEFKPEDYPKLKELIARLKKKKREGFNLFDSDDYLDSIYHFVSTGKPNWRHNGVCDSPNLYFAILPDGRFAPCCDHRLKEKIYVYDDNFPEIYRGEALNNSVKHITTKCGGCNFGSYPEMSLSARSYSTLFERLRLQQRTKKKGLVPLTDEEIMKIFKEVKAKYPIYDTKREFIFREKKKWPKAPNIPERLWQTEESSNKVIEIKDDKDNTNSDINSQ
jgi:MoaA/NifB/PqqE/SkfB family radical SAM enzyme